MNVLVIGSGGREHAFAWKIKQSPLCDKLFVAPGNAGTAAIAENVAIGVSDFDALGDFSLDNNVELIVVGPEVPLVEGIRDYFEASEKYRNLKIVGPKQDGATLEGSKDFAKEFMAKHNVPTGQYKTFTEATVQEGIEYLNTFSLPIVLKADGLAAGKGVLICQSYAEAEDSLKDMLENKRFGKASASVVIEEYLDGIELSVFVLTDGINYKILPEAKDYKRIGEQDAGPNTGGMGAVSPVSFAKGDFMKKVEEQVVKRTIDGLKKDKIDYIGFVFIGLMNVNGDPYVIEYNVRMGDPETQVVIPRIKSDFLEALNAAAERRLGEVDFELDSDVATTVVMVAGGYPDEYEKGKVISGLDLVDDGLTFHAGTSLQDGAVLTNGGRVMNMTGKGADIQTALKSSYEKVNKVTWEDVYFRKDIGQDLIALEK